MNHQNNNCYKDDRGNRVVAPINSGTVLKQGTLLGMIRDIGIDQETFFKLLGKLRSFLENG